MPAKVDFNLLTFLYTRLKRLELGLWFGAQFNADTESDVIGGLEG